MRVEMWDFRFADWQNIFGSKNKTKYKLEYIQLNNKKQIQIWIYSVQKKQKQKNKYKYEKIWLKKKQICIQTYSVQQ